MNKSKALMKKVAATIFENIPNPGKYVGGLLFEDRKAKEWVVLTNGPEECAWRKKSIKPGDRIRQSNYAKDKVLALDAQKTHEKETGKTNSELVTTVAIEHPSNDKTTLKGMEDEMAIRETPRKISPVPEVKREIPKEYKNPIRPEKTKGSKKKAKGGKQRRLERRQDDIFLRADLLKNLPGKPEHSARVLHDLSVDDLTAEEIERLEIEQPHRSGLKGGTVIVPFFEYRNKVVCAKCGAVRFVKDQDVKQVKYCALCIHEIRKERRRKVNRK